VFHRHRLGDPKRKAPEGALNFYGNRELLSDGSKRVNKQHCMLFTADPEVPNGTKGYHKGKDR